MSTSITVEFAFDAAHRVPGHEGACRSLHGHRYRGEVTLKGIVQATGPQAGMVEDFQTVAANLAALVAEWDHRTLLAADDPLAEPLDRALAALALPPVVRLPYVPTAERLAEAICRWLRLTGDLTVVEVRLWETPKFSATFRP